MADAETSPASSSSPEPVQGSAQIVKLLMVREKTTRYNQALSCAEMVVQAVKPLFKGAYREMIVVCGLNSSNMPTILHTLSLGSQVNAFLTPANVFKPLLLANSYSFVLIHNHPAGAMHPSNADIQLTQKLESLGKNLDIPMLDHIIVNHDCSEYITFKRMGLMGQK